ncbi:MAG TPA: DUF547 domain-containing protein [Candidatus Bathyarchaeia archaeon]|jgi:hypothetical protein|nr:DUF547 domain-containing protein [Candidatus Bathyarchaeia archaeon]
MRTRLAAAIAASILLVAGSAPADTASLESASASYGALLEKYVTPRGVRYAAWRTSGDDLKSGSAVLAAFRGADPVPLEPNARKALWINLYNAKVLELVLVGHPKTSIRELSKGMSGSEVFDRRTILYQDKGMSLNELEKRLRGEFKDPRVLFALDRSARSSPQLRPEAYDPARIDEQLDDQVRAFLARPDAVEVKTAGGRPTLTVSRIFQVYADDFKTAGGVGAFLAKYGPADAATAASGKAKIEYAEFDWGLNAAP